MKLASSAMHHFASPLDMTIDFADSGALEPLEAHCGRGC